MNQAEGTEILNSASYFHGNSFGANVKITFIEHKIHSIVWNKYLFLILWGSPLENAVFKIMQDIKELQSTISGRKRICLHFTAPAFIFHQSVFKQVVLFALTPPNFILQIGQFKRKNNSNFQKNNPIAMLPCGTCGLVFGPRVCVSWFPDVQ